MDHHADDRVEAVTEAVIGCAIGVHRALGPGLLESIYRKCLAIEMKVEGLQFERERRVNLTYRGQNAGGDLKIDLLVEGEVIVEVKAIERLHPVHQAQVITYLKLTGFRAGLLLNFNATSLRAGLKRLDHPDLYAARRKPRVQEFSGANLPEKRRSEDP